MIVVPSSREQFGIVAVESMMCGCPVVASRVGGLQDIIIDGLTGTLFPVDDPSTLANVLSGYLRNSQRTDWQGEEASRWAHRMFAADTTYGDILDLYRETVPGPKTNLDHPHRTVRSWKAETVLPALEEVLGGPPRSVSDISVGPHLSLRVDLSESTFHAKYYSDFPPDVLSVLPSHARMQNRQLASELVQRTVFNHDNPATPRIVTVERELLVTQWCSAVSSNPGEVPIESIKVLAKSFREYHELGEDDPTVVRTQAALKRLSEEPSLELISAHDVAMAEVNSLVTGGARRFAMTHPTVEALRLSALLDEETWILPRRFSVRARSVLTDLARTPVVPAVPRLCHGSLKSEHVLRNEEGALVACDLDECRYVVGCFDEAHAVHEEILRDPMSRARRRLGELRSLVPGGHEFRLGLQWLVVLLVYEAISLSVRGRTDGIARTQGFLRDFYAACPPEALLGENETRSP